MSVSIRLSLQRGAGLRGLPGLPRRPDFLRWTRAAMRRDAELTIRLVGAEEGQVLNRQYRGRDNPTNVLSFAYDEGEDMPLPPGMPLVGDLVLCAPVVAAEAEAQRKPLLSHYAHMVVHGMLHLQGYDHQDEAEAARMEGLEREILAGLGIADPYAGE